MRYARSLQCSPEKIKHKTILIRVACNHWDVENCRATLYIYVPVNGTENAIQVYLGNMPWEHVFASAAEPRYITILWQTPFSTQVLVGNFNITLSVITPVNVSATKVWWQLRRDHCLPGCQMSSLRTTHCESWGSLFRDLGLVLLVQLAETLNIIKRKSFKQKYKKMTWK